LDITARLEETEQHLAQLEETQQRLSLKNTEPALETGNCSSPPVPGNAPLRLRRNLTAIFKKATGFGTQNRPKRG